MKSLHLAAASVIAFLPLACKQTPPADLPGLVARWSGDGVLADASGQRSARMVGEVQFAEGINGKAFQFDGASLLSVPGDGAAMAFSGSFTAEAWVNYAVMGGDSDTILSKGDQQGGPVDWAMTVSVNSRLRPHVFTDAGGWHYFDCRSALLPHQWYHVAMTYDGKQLRGFVNGVEDGAVAISGKVRVSPGDLRIGGYAPFPGKTGYAFFNGRIDGVAFYDRPLSAEEIVVRAKAR